LIGAEKDFILKDDFEKFFKNKLDKFNSNQTGPWVKSNKLRKRKLYNNSIVADHDAGDEYKMRSFPAIILPDIKIKGYFT
jgi:hypothetical protein